MARSFNGSSDYISVGGASAFSVGAQDFTAAAWAYPTAVNTYQLIFGKDVSGGRDWGFGLGNTSGQLIYYHAVGGFPIVQGGSVSANTWQHLAVTRVGSTVTLYLNGSAATTGTDSGTATETTTQLLIGRRGYSGFEQPFGGRLAEAAVWIGTGLAAGQIAQLAAGVVPPLVRRPTAYWPLIGRASPEPDPVGGYAGTLTGTSQTDHPRAIYARGRRAVFVPAAGGGGGSPVGAARHHYLMQGMC